MAKAEKKAPERKKRGNYDEKLKVNASFGDIIGAAMKHADNNSKAKKKP